jgi:hypothetical protein
MSPNISAGTLGIKGSSGMEYNNMWGGGGGNRFSMNAGTQMDNLPVDGKVSMEKAMTASRASETATQSAMAHQQSFERSMGSAMSIVMGKAIQGGYDKSNGNTQDLATKTAVSEGVSAGQSTTEKLARDANISVGEAATIIGDFAAKLGTGGGSATLSGNLSKKYDESTTAKIMQSLDSSSQSDRKKLADFATAISNNEQATQGFNFSQSERTGVESNLQQARSSKAAQTASLQEAKSYKEQATEALKLALSGGFDLSKSGQMRAGVVAYNNAIRDGQSHNQALESGVTAREFKH